MDSSNSSSSPTNNVSTTQIDAKSESNVADS
eukprot:CAMPEP_0118718160 /NCGR_PEP_ID=MMETSP0800-20121206/28626_1 /TAXON_ID=210618 ORGANISM="Striatella unipunctata, Strain CCMP2910" /NCGR_SAMPLE_ID=MMETSP0800 /ASSEMBLY_ACC=CAM_ASM_000638 /LENGTH=30 /DNA_ID= /DNA_START= /DNA_END= /DNA_ORIENTATION=